MLTLHRLLQNSPPVLVKEYYHNQSVLRSCLVQWSSLSASPQRNNEALKSRGSDAPLGSFFFLPPVENTPVYLINNKFPCTDLVVDYTKMLLLRASFHQSFPRLESNFSLDRWLWQTQQSARWRTGCWDLEFDQVVQEIKSSFELTFSLLYIGYRSISLQSATPLTAPHVALRELALLPTLKDLYALHLYHVFMLTQLCLAQPGLTSLSPPPDTRAHSKAAGGSPTVGKGKRNNHSGVFPSFSLENLHMFRRLLLSNPQRLASLEKRNAAPAAKTPASKRASILSEIWGSVYVAAQAVSDLKEAVHTTKLVSGELPEMPSLILRFDPCKPLKESYFPLWSNIPGLSTQHARLCRTYQSQLWAHRPQKAILVAEKAGKKKVVSSRDVQKSFVLKGERRVEAVEAITAPKSKRKWNKVTVLSPSSSGPAARADKTVAQAAAGFKLPTSQPTAQSQPKTRGRKLSHARSQSEPTLQEVAPLPALSGLPGNVVRAQTPRPKASSSGSVR